MKSIVISAALATAFAAAGCTHQNAGRVAADFGTSHAAMLEHQYFDPQAARAPQSEPPTGLDGQKVEGILKAYREDNADRELGDAGATQINILTGGAQ